ncbi:PAS domain-containing protein, partial [Rhizobium leguminosarum]|uniref:PAS domain-containing protein n=1 Tax=Rhizobium leguminosarum TaxID=384 RepID=UPI003F948E01
CNDLFCQISGFSRDELIGTNHRILNSGHHDRGFFTEMYRTIGCGLTWAGTICNRRKDGKLYWVDTTIVPQLDARGRAIGYLAIRFEVTEH